MFPPELVDRVVAEAGRREQRQRLLPARVVVYYVLGLAQFTRKHRRVYLGASPRAALALLRASKARALAKGRDFVLPDDVKYLAPFVLATATYNSLRKRA